MKKLTKIVALIVAILFAGSQSAFAVTTTTASTSITAAVDQVLSLAIAIHEETSPGPPPVLGPAVTTMNHGTLIRSNDASGNPNALRGKAFHVFLGVNSSGRPYTITSSLNPLMNGATALPRALGVFPIQATTGGTSPTSIGGTLASNQDAVGTGKLLYTSTAAGPSGVIELVYGLSGGNLDGSSPFTGWQPVPPGQLSGTYGPSTITYTLTV